MGSRPSPTPFPDNGERKPGTFTTSEATHNELRLAPSFHSGFFENLARWLQRVKVLTGASGVAIGLKFDRVISCLASEGTAPEIGVEIQPNRGICGKCISEGKVVLEQNLEGEIKSVLAVPIMVGDEVEGIVVAFSATPYAFPEQSVIGCKKIADEIADTRRTSVLVLPVTPLTNDDTEKEPSLPTAESAIATVTDESPAEVPFVQTARYSEVISSLPTTLPDSARDASVPFAALPIEYEPAPISRTDTSAPSFDRFTVLDAYKETSYKWLDSIHKRVSTPILIGALVILALFLAVTFGVVRLREKRPPSVKVHATPNPPATNPFTFAVTPDTPKAAPAKESSVPEQKTARRAKENVLQVDNGVSRTPSNAAEVSSPPIALENMPPTTVTPIIPSTTASPKLAAPPIATRLETTTSVPLPSTIPPTAATTGSVPARLLNRVDPIYPAATRAIGRGGSVLLSVGVKQDGRVGNISVVSGDSLLVAAAKDAVAKWKYTPASLNGHPIESTVQVTIVFKMTK